MTLYEDTDCDHIGPLPLGRAVCDRCGASLRWVVPFDSDNLYRFDPEKDVKGIAYLITTGALTLVEVSDWQSKEKNDE